MVFFTAFSFDVVCPEEERSITEIDGKEVISCSSDEFLWETQMAKLLFSSCCLMVPGSLVLTSSDTVYVNDLSKCLLPIQM